jgi:hypothetical protein
LKRFAGTNPQEVAASIAKSKKAKRREVNSSPPAPIRKIIEVFG